MKRIERYIRHSDGRKKQMTGMTEIYKEEAVLLKACGVDIDYKKEIVL